MLKRLFIVFSLVGAISLQAQPTTNSFTNSVVTYAAFTNLIELLFGTNNFNFSTLPIGNTNNSTNYTVQGKFTAAGGFQFLNNTNNPGYSLVADANGNISAVQNGRLSAVYSGTTVGLTNVFTNINTNNQALYEAYLVGDTVAGSGTIQVGWPDLNVTNSLTLATNYNVTNFTGITFGSFYGGSSKVIVWVTGTNLQFYKVALYKITD